MFAARMLLLLLIFVCLEHVRVWQLGCAAVRVFGVRVCLLLLLFCACLFVCFGGGRKGRGPAHCMWRTNGRVRVSAYVRARVCQWVADRCVHMYMYMYMYMCVHVQCIRLQHVCFLLLVLRERMKRGSGPAY